MSLRRSILPGLFSVTLLSCLIIGRQVIAADPVTSSANSITRQTIALPKETAPAVYFPTEFAQAIPTPDETPSGETPPDGLTTVEETSVPNETDSPALPKAAPVSQYVLEYNRSPIVGNRLRLEGIYPETRIGFTRPTPWKIRGAKTLIRFQHSPALLADRSYLTVRVNDRSVGSVPLDNPNGQLTEALFEIPPDLIQDFNEITVLASQQTSETCTNPADPMLWTEVLPDSKLILDYEPQPATLDFSQYPYPFIDILGLEPNRISYLKPNALTNDWLTQVSQLQAVMGRLATYKAVETQLINNLDGLQYNDGVMMVGTPSEQPLFEGLNLPFQLKEGQWLDGQGQSIPKDVGVLMMTTLPETGTPLLIVTGNQAAGVTKAVQALVQTPNRQLGTGQAILIQSVTDMPSPTPRDWPGYLPTDNTFNLSQLSLLNGEAVPDSLMVRGINPNPIDLSFRALPNDRFSRGSTMNLDYSYSPQVNARTSAIEVKLDDTTIAAKRLRNGGNTHERMKLDLPSNLIRPDSKLTVQFVLYPRDTELCGLATDDQLWGELHSNTEFHLNRDISAAIPDLSLFKTGFPLTMPQDLSEVAIAMPDVPSDSEIETLLALGERLGRLSKADSVKLVTYLASEIPDDVKARKHWAAIGLRDRFPLTDIFQPNTFALNPEMTRQWQDNQVQTLTDQQGLVQAMVSPWNSERMIVAFTSQTETGMAENRNLLEWDTLFYRLNGDTVLLNRNQPNPSPYNPGDYSLTSLNRAKTVQIDQTTWIKHLLYWLQSNWLIVPVGIIFTAMLLYGVSQLYLNRDQPSEEA